MEQALVEEINELRSRICQLEARKEEAERALADSKEIYRSITNDVLDSSRVGIIILDSEFKVVRINRSLARYFELRIEDAIGKSQKQLVQDKLKYLFEKPDDYAKAILATYENNTYIEQLECRILPTQCREERWLELWSRPIRTGLYQGGRIEHYTDITERKQAQAFLKITKDYPERLINSSTDIIISVDMNRKIIEFNKAAQQAFGYSKDEVLGKHVDMLYADPGQGLKIHDKTLENGNSANEISNRKKNGEVFKVLLSSSVIYDGQNRPSGLMGISRKVTDVPAHGDELLKAEKLESIGVLAGGLAHEFNNLLTSIIGSVTLVKSSLKAQNHAGSRDALEVAMKASHHAQALTQKLLTFAKGGAPLRNIVPANHLLRDIISSTLSNKPTVEHRVNIAENLPCVKVDKEQVKQVVQNIVTNAFEAMSGSGILEIDVEKVVIDQSLGLPLADGSYVKVIIMDSGVGIPKDQILKIFDPFYTTKSKNSGLGLTTAYSIIRQHGGFITVDSQIGFGTAFSIYLPVCSDAANATKLKSTLQENKPSSAQAKGKILVLDDEQCITAVASKMLTKVGYTVQTADTGEKAIELFRKAKDEGYPFDLVILDLAIAGGIGGKEVIQIVRDEDPHIKAIVSSGYFDDPIMANYRDYGFDQVVSKPYTYSALTCAVNALIATRG